MVEYKETEEALQKLASLMSSDDMQFPESNDKNKNSSNQPDKENDNRNEDDGEVINLTNVADNDFAEEENIHDLTSEDQEEDHELDSEEEEIDDFDILDEDNENLSAVNSNQEAWKEAVLDELKDIDDIDNSTNNQNVDLDEDFGIKDKNENIDFPNYNFDDSDEKKETRSDYEIREDDKHEIGHNDHQEEIISDKTSKEVKDAFFDLKNQMSDIGTNKRNVELESFFAEIARPLMKDWIDKNLPSLVKKIVQQEINKLVNETK